MKNRIKILILILALLFSMLSLSGCSSAPDTQDFQSTQIFADDTLILTVEGSPIYWPEFRYWLNYSLLYNGFTPGTEIDWDAQYTADMTLSEYLINDAVNSAALFRVIDRTADTMALSISDEDEELIALIMDENASYFESEEEYQTYLSENCLTEELQKYLLRASCNYYNIFVEMFGATGELISDSEVLAYGTENGYYRAKCIILPTVDNEGNAYSSDKIQETYTQLESILEQINAAEDPVAEFDNLMLENSDTSYLNAYPDGFQFLSGDMGSQLQSVIEQLNDYEISAIITEDDAYSIIMRLPLDPDAAAVSNTLGYSLRYITATYVYETLANTWTAEANVEYSDNFSLIKLSDWF